MQATQFFKITFLAGALSLAGGLSVGTFLPHSQSGMVAWAAADAASAALPDPLSFGPWPALKLTDAQKAKIRPLLKAQGDAVKAVCDSARAGHEATKAAIDAILTAKQKAQPVPLEQLDLTEGQMDAISKVIDADHAKMDALMASGKALHEKTVAAINVYLTAAQQKKLALAAKLHGPPPPPCGPPAGDLGGAPDDGCGLGGPPPAGPLYGPASGPRPFGPPTTGNRPPGPPPGGGRRGTPPTDPGTGGSDEES